MDKIKELIKKDYNYNELPKLSRDILDVCEKHNFYYFYVMKLLHTYEFSLLKRDYKEMVKLGGFGFYICRMFHSDNELSIQFLFILPQHRRKGIARELLKTFSNVCVENKIETLSFTTDNSVMLKLGVSEGFNVVGKTYTGIELYLKKKFILG